MRPKNVNDKPPPPPRDHRQEVTNEVVRLLEAGTSPWQQPWTADLSMPMNPTTGKAYRGGNVISLMIASMVRGYSDPRFMTFLQAEQKGWHVRKGEKGTRIEFWEPKPGNHDEGADDDEKRSRLIHRVYSVFNAQQIEGIPPIEVKERKPFEVIEAAEAAIKASGAEIHHGGAKAY
jgi:antirestriction protein ArdC